MPLDYRDLLLEAQANLASTLQSFTMQIMLPRMEEALSMQWMMLPDEAKEVLKKEQPRLYQRLMSTIEQK